MILRTLALRDAPPASLPPDRGALIDIARDQVRQHGLAGLDLREVASRGDISARQLQMQFGGRDGLIRALYAQWSEDMEARLRDTLPDTGPESLVWQAAYIYRALACMDRSLFLLAASPEAREAGIFGHLQQSPAFTLFAEVIDTGMREGVFHASDDPLRTARTLWAAIHGVVLLEICTGVDEAEGLAMLREAVDLLMRGLCVRRLAA